MTTHRDLIDQQWRETVRDIYDRMHFGEGSVFTGSVLAQEIVKFIEERHPRYFKDAAR